MDEAKQQEIRQWLIKASRDLAPAERLLAGDPPYLDTAVYHYQQTAEKALKAYLTLKDSPFRKVHDLSALVEQSSEFDGTFVQLREAAETLTPYGVAFRYPGSVLEPAPSEAKEALRFARIVLDFVAGKIPAKVKSGVEF